MKKTAAITGHSVIATVRFIYGISLPLLKKPNEEREFSEKELEQIKQAALQDITNPRAVMLLFSMETGMRAGELASVKTNDIKDRFIHVHSQQRKAKDSSDHLEFEDINHTKDERQHPHDGRYIPITKACSSAITHADKLPGDSIYLFHDASGRPITKDSYARYLHRLCNRLGTNATNNHAFRIAFNSRLIGLGLDAADRSLIIGHRVQTNENNYSVSDRRQLEQIKNRLELKKEVHYKLP